MSLSRGALVGFVLIYTVVVGWINFIVLMSDLIIFKLYEVMSLYIYIYKISRG